MHDGDVSLVFGTPVLELYNPSNIRIDFPLPQLVSVSHSAYTSALSLFPDMKEHEGLMKPEELKTMEVQAKSQCTDSYLQHYYRLTEKKQKVKITSLLQEFFNSKYPWILNAERGRQVEVALFGEKTLSSSGR